ADCGTAYERASQAGHGVGYRCHAGLTCFATPIEVSGKQIVILGGRAFVSRSDYENFLENYSDLEQVRSGVCLRSISFVRPAELQQASALVSSRAESHFAATEAQRPIAVEAEEVPKGLLDAHLEIIRLTDQLESRKRALGQFYDFLRGV